MKQYISPDDLLKLNSSQILNLRDMWIPKPNTMAMARICRDVINDEYDTVVFVIGEVIVQEHNANLVLRRFKLMDEFVIDQEVELQDEIQENRDEELPFEPLEPDQYFSKDDCLPVLSIGEMIEILSRLKYGQDGFTVFVPPVRRFVGDRGCRVVNVNELEFEEEELCDALWNALVEYL